MAKQNPFILNKYLKPKYFCDRKDETDKAISNIKAAKNFLVTSNAAEGKTTFVKNLLYVLKKSTDFNKVYFELYNPINIAQFIISFGKILEESFRPKSQKKIDQLNSILFNTSVERTFTAYLNYDEDELLSKLTELLRFLNFQKKSTIIVIDNIDIGIESINDFENKVIKIFLEFTNIRLIFIGKKSIKSVNNEDIILLDKLSIASYKDFILKNFNESGISIKPKIVQKILNWTKCDPRSTQLICSKLWEEKQKKITPEIVDNITSQLLAEYNHLFLMINKLLSTYQWRLLTAIANEGTALQVTSNSFINKYNLNAPSSVKTALNALLEKELIFRVGNSYEVRNVIFGNWLKIKFS